MLPLSRCDQGEVCTGGSYCAATGFCACRPGAVVRNGACSEPPIGWLSYPKQRTHFVRFVFVGLAISGHCFAIC